MIIICRLGTNIIKIIIITYQSDGWLKVTISGSRFLPFPQTSASGVNPSGTLSIVGRPKLLWTKNEFKNKQVSDV